MPTSRRISATTPYLPCHRHHSLHRERRHAGTRPATLRRRLRAAGRPVLRRSRAEGASRRTSRLARPNFTIAPPTRSRSMRSSGLRSSRFGVAPSRNLIDSYGLPQLRSDETRKMVNIGRRNDEVGSAECDGLSRQDHISVDCLVTGRRLALLACCCPENSSLPHRRRRDRQVFEQIRQRVQALDACRSLGSQQLAANFVVGDLRDHDPNARRDERLQPFGARAALR